MTVTLIFMEISHNYFNFSCQQLLELWKTHSEMNVFPISAARSCSATLHLRLKKEQILIYLFPFRQLTSKFAAGD